MRLAPPTSDEALTSAAYRRRQMELFRCSVLKQAKWRELAAAVGETEGLDALDLGSDNGVISLLFRERGGRWRSGDLTDETVDSIRRMVDTQVFRIEGSTLPIAERSLDLVVVVDLLEHLPDDRALLREIARCLRPGGRALLNVPHAANWRVLPRVRDALGLTDEWHGHLRPGYDARSLARLLPIELHLKWTRQYSKAFSHSLDTALNWIYVRGARSRARTSGKGVVVTGASLDHRKAAQLRMLYPFMRAFAALDALLPLGRGYMLLAMVERR